MCFREASAVTAPFVFSHVRCCSYVKHFYDTRGGNPEGFDAGDISARLEHREQMQCKPFKWCVIFGTPARRIFFCPCSRRWPLCRFVSR